jgi:hypothetical protein
MVTKYKKGFLLIIFASSQILPAAPLPLPAVYTINAAKLLFMFFVLNPKACLFEDTNYRKGFPGPTITFYCKIQLVSCN